jgi:hypothetical protein
MPIDKLLKGSLQIQSFEGKFSIDERTLLSFAFLGNFLYSKDKE